MPPSSTKALEKPFRVIINSSYNQTTGKSKGLCVAGKIDTGYVEKGAKCLVVPACTQITIKGKKKGYDSLFLDIFVGDEKRNFAVSGENAVFVVQAQDFEVNSLRYYSHDK